MFAGARLGYDFQFDDFVVGVVGDVNYTKISGNITIQGPPGMFQTEVPWNASIRARAGFLVTPETLVYAHGGAAYARLSWASGNQVVGGPPGSPRPGPFTSGHGKAGYWGWVFGAGVEHRLTERASWFAEVDYTDYGKKSFLFYEADDDQWRALSVKLTGLRVTGGFNFRFWTQ